MIKKRHLLRNEAGYSTVLETLISVGISITLLTVFFYSANTLYEVQDNPESNLESKTMGIMETLITSTGQDASQSPEWHLDPGSVESLGLSTSPTVEYGIVTINRASMEVIINNSYRFDANEYGLESTCFLTGTKVVMADGSYKNIEDIVVGDMVKCYDQMKHVIVDSKVTHVFHHNANEMGEYYLVINDQLRVTPNHLIYSDDGWIEASNLKIGDSLFYPSTDYPVLSINKIFDRVETFNIEVEGHHNYFVAMDNIDALVHNPLQFYADAGEPYGGAPNESMDFRGSAGCGDEPYSYSWDFNESDGIQEDGTGPNPTYTYTSEGEYIVTLTVTDNNCSIAVDNTTATVSNDPIAKFKWFDKDGLGWDNTVFLNAAGSAGASLQYSWDWNSDGIYDYEDEDPPNFHHEKAFQPGREHLVTLKVENTFGHDTVTHTVEVNTVGPEPDPRPWVLTGKNLWPEGTFSSYGEDYYIIYTDKGDFGDGREMYMYEIKRKTSTVKPILDYNKLVPDGLFSGIVSYEVVKGALGLEGEFGGAMNFNIEVEIGDDPPLFFGASDQDAGAKEVTSRRVLIYDPPKVGAVGNPPPDDAIGTHPEYKYGEITVRVFIGGTPP